MAKPDLRALQSALALAEKHELIMVCLAWAVQSSVAGIERGRSTCRPSGVTS